MSAAIFKPPDHPKCPFSKLLELCLSRAKWILNTQPATALRQPLPRPDRQTFEVNEAAQSSVELRRSNLASRQ
jgi:hypothetical protein